MIRPKQTIMGATTKHVRTSVGAFFVVYRVMDMEKSLTNVCSLVCCTEMMADDRMIVPMIKPVPVIVDATL